jgi:hypothetical protein
MYLFGLWNESNGTGSLGESVTFYHKWLLNRSEDDDRMDIDSDTDMVDADFVDTRSTFETSPGQIPRVLQHEVQRLAEVTQTLLPLKF